jgi:hypothetical protein
MDPIRAWNWPRSQSRTWSQWSEWKWIIIVIINVVLFSICVSVGGLTKTRYLLEFIHIFLHCLLLWHIS